MPLQRVSLYYHSIHMHLEPAECKRNGDTHTHTHTCACTHTCMRMHTWTCTHAHAAHSHAHTQCTHVHTCTLARAHALVCIQAHMRAHTPTRRHSERVWCLCGLLSKIRQQMEQVMFKNQATDTTTAKIILDVP